MSHSTLVTCLRTDTQKRDKILVPHLLTLRSPFYRRRLGTTRVTSCKFHDPYQLLRHRGSTRTPDKEPTVKKDPKDPYGRKDVYEDGRSLQPSSLTSVRQVFCLTVTIVSTGGTSTDAPWYTKMDEPNGFCRTHTCKSLPPKSSVMSTRTL